MMRNESCIFYKERDGKELASVEISAAEFNRIKPAVRKVDEVFRAEELYHMLVTSLLAFNDLIVREADRSRFAEHGSREFGFFRIECNRLAAGFLTVLNMYSEYGKDGVKYDLQKMKLCEYICSLPDEECREIFKNLKIEIDNVVKWFGS